MREVSIGEAAKTTGVKIPTIRFYEEIGLLPPNNAK
jgi:DNA-binding transcriptional MerR regulator